MPIYDFLQQEETQASELSASRVSVREDGHTKGRWFSQVAARFFFLLLLIVDVVWMVYALISFLFSTAGRYATAGKFPWLQKWQGSRWIALRRSVVCAMALMIALFSPSFGMMIACTYFLMYDKKGITEVVPSSLQTQLYGMIPKDADAQ